MYKLAAFAILGMAITGQAAETVKTSWQHDGINKYTLPTKHVIEPIQNPFATDPSSANKKHTRKPRKKEHRWKHTRKPRKKEHRWKHRGGNTKTN